MSVGREMISYSSMVTERRKFPRFPVSLPIEYWKGSESRHRGGVAGDISKMGLLVLSIHKMAIGTELKITVLFPIGYALTKFHVLGTVVWKGRHVDVDWSGYKYGVKFARISETDRLKLEYFINAQLSVNLSMKEASMGTRDSLTQEVEAPVLLL